MTDLSGKLILVSGGARDIGRAVVLELARAGAQVAFTHQSTLPDATLAAAADLPGKAFAARVEVTDASAVDRFVRDARTHFGGAHVHGIVNNAGGLVARKRLEEMDGDFWDQVLSLNAKSAFLFTRAGVAAMAESAETTRSVVTIASQAGRDGGGAGASAYAASKGALMAWTRALAKELGPRRIRVNAVCPGLINTSFHDTFTKPEVRQRVASMTPLGREGQATEVAKLALFLLSDAASFTTGVAYDINGGLAFS